MPMERNQSSLTDPFIHPHLLPIHLDYLSKRAVSEATARACRLTSAGRYEIEQMLGINHPSKGGGLGIPYIGYGEPTWRVRYDLAPSKGDRWRMARGEGVRPYLPPHLPSDFWQDTSKSLAILEGPIKALASCDAGQWAIALGGVDTGHNSILWREKGLCRLHPELLARIAWKGRVVYIGFDANRRTNPSVALGEARLCQCLKAAGAIVRIIDIPDTGLAEGPDDFIAASGAEAYLDLIKEAQFADPLDLIGYISTLPKLEKLDRASSLISSLPFAAALHLGGTPLQEKVQIMLGKIAGIGKRSVTNAVTTFSAKLVAKLREEEGLPTTDEKIAELNKKYAVVFVGGTGFVLWEDESSDHPGRVQVKLHTEKDFKLRWKNEFVFSGGGDKEEKVTLADHWLSSPHRRQYNSMVFEPGKEVDADRYNLWQGWNCVEADGDWSEYRDHMFRNIANGRMDIFLYLLEWMADAIQNPTKKTGIAIALRGKQGTGKTFFCQEFGAIYGPHFLTVSTGEHLTGKFNQHLQNLCLIFADEAYWAGDKGAEGRFKSLITDHKQLIEGKGRDAIMVNNYLRVMMSTNSDWVAPVAPEERRFAVFDVGDGNIQDREFFGRLTTQMANGGREALFKFLRAWKLGTVNLNKIPTTEAQADQKIRSMSPIDAWWLGCLQRGYIHPQREWSSVIPCEETRISFIDDAGIARGAGFENQKTIGARLRKLCPKMDSLRATMPVFDMKEAKIQSDGQRQCYQFPSLDECRNAFSNFFASRFSWDGKNLIEPTVVDVNSFSENAREVLREFGILKDTPPPEPPPSAQPPPDSQETMSSEEVASQDSRTTPNVDSRPSAASDNTQVSATEDKTSYAQVHAPVPEVAAPDDGKPYEPILFCIQCGGVAIDDRNGYCIRHKERHRYQPILAPDKWMNAGDGRLQENHDDEDESDF